jgi:hypothetical protein
MKKQIKREALLKNYRGQYRYLFNWKGGGFNDIWAKNLAEFKKELSRQFPGSESQVDYDTLYKATPSQSREWDRVGDMMCW